MQADDKLDWLPYALAGGGALLLGGIALMATRPKKEFVGAVSTHARNAQGYTFHEWVRAAGWDAPRRSLDGYTGRQVAKMDGSGWESPEIEWRKNIDPAEKLAVRATAARALAEFMARGPLPEFTERS